MKRKNISLVDLLRNYLCGDSFNSWSSYEAFCRTIEIIIRTYFNNKKILVCGNGGSAADAMHIAGELIKSFCIERKIDNLDYKRFLNSNKINITPGIPAIALSSDPVIMSACGNDLGFDNIYAQQINALGNDHDILIALTTSGNSKNIINACKVAFVKGMTIIIFTGEKINKELEFYSHIIIKANAFTTAIIQEQHEKMYHVMCRIIEDEIFNKEDN